MVDIDPPLRGNEWPYIRTRYPCPGPAQAAESFSRFPHSENPARLSKPYPSANGSPPVRSAYHDSPPRSPPTSFPPASTRRTSLVRGSTLPSTPTTTRTRTRPPQTLLSPPRSTLLLLSLLLPSPPTATCPPPTPGPLLLPISPVLARTQRPTATRPRNPRSISIPGLSPSTVSQVRSQMARSILLP